MYHHFLLLIVLLKQVQAPNPLPLLLEVNWNFVVSFHYIPTENDAKHYFCTGAAVSKYLVLTLAKCFYDRDITKIKILQKTGNFRNPEDYTQIEKIYSIPETDSFKPRDIVLASVRPRLSHFISLPNQWVLFTDQMMCKGVDWLKLLFQNQEKDIQPRTMITSIETQSFYKFWAESLLETPNSIDQVQLS